MCLPEMVDAKSTCLILQVVVAFLVKKGCPKEKQREV